MFLEFFFKRLTRTKQVNLLQTKGVPLGTKVKQGRKVFFYMYKSIFVEVLYKNDYPSVTAERVQVIRGLNSLNDYLEKEFKTAF